MKLRKQPLGMAIKRCEKEDPEKKCETGKRAKIKACFYIYLVFSENKELFML